MSALTRAALEESPLADLHALASELGLEGFRRLRKSDLIKALLESQGIADDVEPEPELELEPESEPESEPEPEPAAPADEYDDARSEAGERPPRGRGRQRGGRGRRGSTTADESRASSDDSPAAEDEIVEGVVELLGNGSAFVRVDPPGTSDADVYVSAAQVRRCELVSGDRVTGPMRPPRRSERYPSLVRIDTIDGRPADEVAGGTRFDDLPCEFPTEPIEYGSQDPLLATIASLAPIGRGSRALIVGGPHSGKSETLRRLGRALSAASTENLSLVLAGIRPEEIAEWSDAGVEPVAAISFTASSDSQGQTIGSCVDAAKRIAARGGDAIVLIDTLDGLGTATARRLLGAGRNIAAGGSLTVIATASAPVGGETTLIELDAAQARDSGEPSVRAAGTGTLRAERLVGEDGVAAIRGARA